MTWTRPVLWIEKSLIVRLYSQCGGLASLIIFNLQNRFGGHPAKLSVLSVCMVVLYVCHCDLSLERSE